MQQVTDKLWVAAQPDRNALKEAQAAGISLVINSRLKDEDGACGEETAAIAGELGLGYAWIPMRPGVITEDKVRQLQRRVNAADGGVLAHCRSGTRSLSLWAVGEVLDGRMKVDEVEPFGRKHGIDLSGASKWLEARAAATGRPEVTAFFDRKTSSIQYVVTDPATKKCAIIDPVLDFDEKSGATATFNAERILDFIGRNGLQVDWILDTHPHADHFSAASYLKTKTGAPTAIGGRISEVQALWKEIYNWPDFQADGSQWDKLFSEGERFKVGDLDARVLFSPGHTLASITYVIGDAAFVHDTLFMPDSGTARADFPGGSASRLWRSIEEILAQPDETRIFTGHDYQPGGREPLWESTVAEQKASNTHIARCKDEASYVAVREARDRTLPMPKLILHALQVNINGGRLPEPEANGRRYLKFPLDALGAAVWG